MGESELSVTWQRLVVMKKGTLAAGVKNAVSAPCASQDTAVRASLLLLLPFIVPEGGIKVSGQLSAPHRSITHGWEGYARRYIMLQYLFFSLKLAFL